MFESSTKQKALIVAATLALSACATGGNEPDGYTTSAFGQIWRSGFNICWRNAFWTPAQATMECDPDLVPRPKPAAPPPAPVVSRPPPPPPPAPAPAAPPPAPAPAAPPPVAPAPPPPPPPPAPPKPVTEKITLAADVLFDFDKAAIKPEGRSKMDDLVTKVRNVSLEVIIVIGHTDSVGSDAYNQSLSVRRAEAVKAYMVSKGVESNRIYTEGKGKKQPVADNRTDTGRAKNRRVEVEVVGTRTRFVKR